MLRRLLISNIALIDKSDIEFDAGFSALTGETGAGKSILIESVSFVLGDRASRESIRTGAEKASVEAEFVLSEDSPVLSFLRNQELDNGNELFIYREISLNGRNVCRVNGTLVSTAELKELGSMLVDLHGQHAHQSLLDSNTHIHLIDAYANDAEHLIEQVRNAREDAVCLGQELRVLQQSTASRMQRIDMLRFQKDEIERASLAIGEEEELEARRNILRNAEAITEGLNQAYEALFGEYGSLSSLSEARSSLLSIGKYDRAYQELSDRTDDAYYSIEDVAYTLRDARDSFSFDPNELEQIESRLAMIQSLKIKYGRTVAEILDYAESISNELAILTDSSNQTEAKEEAYRNAVKRFAEKSEKLSELRKRTADLLCDKAVLQMKDMGMPHASFETEFRRIPPEELSENGIDSVVFLLSANRGEPVKPLTKVASGGEISRIMLALKIVLSDADKICTLVFDEIDTGISGKIANVVAQKMYELSRRHQVLCVTHLPQIAAYADHHYVASKVSDEYSTKSNTIKLTSDERADELARIMGSSSEDTEAIAHANRLLYEADQYKNNVSNKS